MAALRHLMQGQPRGADRAEYAAYLIKDEAGEELARRLSPELSPQAFPPVVAGLDVYVRKGRTMDRATGRPVKVFTVRAARPADSDGTAEVLASWQASRLLRASYRYRLRKDAGGWVVVERLDERP